MVRTPSFDKNGLKKGTWTPEEDRKLIAYVTRYGCWNWRQLPRFAGLERCGKSCRLRWMNYLRPNIKRGNYTQEEEEIIITLHEKLGNRWCVIASHLPGRTDNEIKNYWHTTLKKRFQKNAVTHENVKATKSNDSGSKQDRDSVQNNGFFHVTPPTTNSNTSVDSGPLSPQLSSSEFSFIATDHTTASTNENLAVEDDLNFLDAYIEPVNENFWTGSFLADISDAPIEIVLDNNGNGTFQGSDTTNTTDAWALSPQSSSTESLVQENEYFAFLEETQPTVEIFWTEPYVAGMSHVPNELLKPFVTESDEYFSPVYDVDLWCQSHMYDETISLF